MHTLPLTYLLYATSSIHAPLTMALALLTSRLTMPTQAVMSEVHALRHLSGHENIVRLIDVVELDAGMPRRPPTPG